MLCFKFYQNRTINEEFDSWGVNAPPPLPRGGQEAQILKIRNNLIQNGGSNPHPKFQPSSSIIKCLNIGGTEIEI